MFRIKICGITNPADAAAAVEAGADAIGLNFCSASKRRIDIEQAREVIAAVPPEMVKVGVFADADPREMSLLFESLDLDVLQFHGREPPHSLPLQTATPLYALTWKGPLAFIKAFPCDPGGQEPVLEYLETCRRLGAVPAMVLLDAQSLGQLGGTGRLADWPAASAYAREPGVPPLVLAGGLTAENVGAAIRHVRPAAVDTASGVERSPGVKDAEKMTRFVAAAKAAFGECGIKMMNAE